MFKLAVVGKDVSQSQSPRMHKFLFSRFGEACSYETISIPPAEFSLRAEELFSRFDAFNVTIPFKGAIIPFLKELRGDAQTFGAVNTVLSKRREGYNTDGFGFLLMLENEGIAVKGKSVLVLGAGGAGRSCIKKLLEAGGEVFVYERDTERLYEVYREFGAFTPLEEIPLRPYDIIINCTGVGMHDTVGKTPSAAFSGGVTEPVGRAILSQCGVAVDLIYIPACSEFLKIAQKEGKPIVNGEAMLFYQAYMADCIILGKQPDAMQAKGFYLSYREGIK